MSEITEDMIIEKAREIQKEAGLSLVDAMVEAEARLQPKPELQTEFSVTINVKPREGKWLVDMFAGHPSLSIEERMGVWLAGEISRARGRVIKEQRAQAAIAKGGAVTVTRDKIEEAMR